MRFACDTGGTFTDLIVEEDDGDFTMYKAPTTPEDPVVGVLNSLKLAAEDRGLELPELLDKGDMFIHGTTHAINAIITGNTAKTAFLTTEGHPDILVLREGGRIEPFNFYVGYPEPYVPRSLTFEVPERVNSQGEVMTALDEAAVLKIIDQLKKDEVEAVAVCLLWSITNSVHELRIAQLLDEHLPGIPYTLSFQLNPALREYRRASSTVIDASLKPLMYQYMNGLTERLSTAGFEGRTLVLTSQGGMIDANKLAEKPIHAINSGPSMAPLAGRYFASQESDVHNAIVADTGGTTYDVSLVRRGRIPKTRETWIGQPFRGHMTGFPSIDIKSVGAGGGSIAIVDEGGVLHVGPQSAGAVPGPVCFGAGGTEVTLTDACLVLGYLDPDFFLGGKMALDVHEARKALDEKIAKPLGLGIYGAANAIVRVATENMVQAIADITVNQGIDPIDSVLIGGGGAAGFNSVYIARRLGCPCLIIPEIGATLSDAGALMSDLSNEYRSMLFTTSADWDRKEVFRILNDLEAQCLEFLEGPGANSVSHQIEYGVEARYAGQVWEIEIPLRNKYFNRNSDLEALIKDFHKAHEEIFAIHDPDSVIEFVGWTASVSCRLREGGIGRLRESSDHQREESTRSIYFEDHGEIPTPIHFMSSLPIDVQIEGPAIVETPFTTIVVDPPASFKRSPQGSLVITP